MLAIEKLREKKATRHFHNYWFFLKKTEPWNIDLTESAINELIKQKSIVDKKAQKGNDSFFRSTKSEVPCESETENWKQCVQQEPIDNQFGETFPKILCEIETPIPNGKGVTPKESNAKTILKLEAKIYPIKKLPWLWNMSTQLQNKHHCKYIFYT